MPDPAQLKIGDRIKFVSVPEEWRTPEFTVHEDSVEFMKTMFDRKWPSRIFKIDEFGIPWIAARIRDKDGIGYHEWNIMEKTGWRIVQKRR